MIDERELGMEWREKVMLDGLPMYQLTFEGICKKWGLPANSLKKVWLPHPDPDKGEGTKFRVLRHLGFYEQGNSEFEIEEVFSDGKKVKTYCDGKLCKLAIQILLKKNAS